KAIHRIARTLVFMVLIVPGIGLAPAQAMTAAEINSEVQEALAKLYAHSKTAKDFGAVAKGILVFPDVYKAGFLVGASFGDGALLENGKTAGYYRTVEASYGLQAGVQSFGYVLFFMQDEALDYLDKSDGWEIGVGPSLVVVDKGFAGSMTTTTAKDDIYAFIFDQKGLMGGIGIKGSKITRIHPD
ncbi:MAG TPA: lipid-binding SYLF domain-containing protein, partial [Nitrospirales bacterium]|nr:lipid-binding SYLF domain-containing protein [Nitrospirales bacterium]